MYVVHTARFIAERRGIAYTELETAVRPTARNCSAGEPTVHPPHARVRHPAEPRARPELPRRLEHPRRDRAARGAGGRRRRARGRWRPRGAERVPRRTHGARARRRARPRPGAGAARRARPARQHHAAFRRRRQARPRCARPRAEQGRRQPALRGRRDRDPAHDRARDRRHVGGDGAEGGRRAVRGRAVDVGLRRAVGAGPARVRRARGAQDPAHRLPPGAERRLRAGRPAPPRPGTAGSLRTLVQHGFAHRRKALARSLALAPGADREIRDRAREALVALGRPADARAESLAPADWRALWERLC